jgi:O-antigen ligase
MAIVGLALLVGPILALGLYEFTPREVVDSRLAATSTVYARLGAWKNIVDESFKSPITGIGLNNLRDVLSQRRITFEGIRSETHDHNSYLAMIAELGLFGLFAYLAMVASIIRMSLSVYHGSRSLQQRWLGVAVVSIMVAYLVAALFANTLYLPTVSHIYLYVFVGAVAGLYSRRGPLSDFSPSVNSRWLRANMPVATR